MSEYYDEKYSDNEFYWGKQPSLLARIFFQKFPPTEGQALIEIGCGQGRDSIFFAQNGYKVSSFDYSAEGVKKSIAQADELKLSIDFFQADGGTGRRRHHRQGSVEAGQPRGAR